MLEFEGSLAREWEIPGGPILGRIPDFPGFSLQELHRVLKVRIQEKFPLVSGRRENKTKHFEILPEFSITKTHSPLEKILTEPIQPKEKGIYLTANTL